MHPFDTNLPPRAGAAGKSAERRHSALPRVETLEDRIVPVAGPSQLQAAQVLTAIATSTSAAFESNYKVFSDTATVFQVANLISAYLHSSQDSLAAAINLPQQNPLAVAIMNQQLGYVTQEVNTLETWYRGATGANTPVNTMLQQLQALALSFRQTEQAATPVIVQELNTGVIVNSAAFNYIPPQFISPGGGGVATPSTVPSITAPPFTVSLMNNQQIQQFNSVSANALLTTSIAITSGVAQPQSNVPFTVAVQVAPVTPGAGIPTGTATLSLDGTVVGTAPLNSSGAASFPVTITTAGQHRLTAVYNGSSVFQPTTNTIEITAT